jgi:hypothetical protein
MGVGKFDPVLDIKPIGGKPYVDATGPLGGLDPPPNEETPMVICVRILQNDVLVAECNGADHGQHFDPPGTGRTWGCPAEVIPGRTPITGNAIGEAVLITGHPDGGFNTYTWTTPVQLRVVRCAP